MPSAGLVYACITHVPIWIEPPPWVTTVHLGEAQGEGRLNLRELAPEWLPHHPVLGGTAGSFALRRHILAQHPDATRVGICQYRKFVSRRRISGVRDRKYRSMDIVPLASLQGGAYDPHLDPGEAPFVLSAPQRFTRLPWYRRGYLKEYTRDHEVEDLLRFTAAAVEVGVLGRREVLAFFNEDVIVPGGVELGVYPAPFWLESIRQIEDVVRLCVERYPKTRMGYQARAWSFCAERLGSWMLLKRLRGDAATGFATRHFSRLNQWAWTRQCVGQLNLITRDADRVGYKGGV